MQLACHCLSARGREEKESLGRGKYQGLRSVWPVLMVSETSQRYFKASVNTMAQTCCKKGKVNKMHHALSHFLCLPFYLGFKRWVLLKPKTVDECAERSQMSPVHPTQIYQALFIKGSLKVHPGKVCGDFDIAWSGSSFRGVSAILPRAQRPWRAQSKPRKLST